MRYKQIHIFRSGKVSTRCISVPFYFDLHCSPQGTKTSRYLVSFLEIRVVTSVVWKEGSRQCKLWNMRQIPKFSISMQFFRL